MRHWVAQFRYDDDPNEDAIRVGYEGEEAGFAILTDDGTDDDLGICMTVEEALDRIEMMFGNFKTFVWLKK